MGKFHLKNSLAMSKPDENGMMWYECAEYADVKEYIKNNIVKIKENYVSIGYWLKYVNEKKMYIEDGFNSIEEFAQANYNISKSVAYRLMEIVSLFSKNGNSPELADEYKDFSKSQLQEMITLSLEQRSEVSPEMTVKEIRDIKQEKKALRLPSKEEAGLFFETFIKESYQYDDRDKVKLKEHLIEHFGKCHSGYRSAASGLSFDCSIRGIKINEKDEITWSQYIRILDQYLDDIQQVKELPADDIISGQLEIINENMETQEYVENNVITAERSEPETQQSNTQDLNVNTLEDFEEQAEKSNTKETIIAFSDESFEKEELMKDAIREIDDVVKRVVDAVRQISDDNNELQKEWIIEQFYSQLRKGLAN